MVAEQSSVKRLWPCCSWAVSRWLQRNDWSSWSGSSAAGRQCVTSCELSDLVSGDCSWYDDFGSLDGWHACARETLNLRWRRSIMEELELRHVVLLGSSLARTACTDGKGTNQCSGHAERTPSLQPNRCGADSCTTCSVWVRAEKRRGDCRTSQRERVQRRGRFSLSITSRKQPRGMSECLGRFSCMTSGSSHNSSIGSNSSGTLVRKYEEQSGESVTDNVRQAVFQAGIKDAAIRDHTGSSCGQTQLLR